MLVSVKKQSWNETPKFKQDTIIKKDNVIICKAQQSRENGLTRRYMSKM